VRKRWRCRQRAWRSCPLVLVDDSNFPCGGNHTLGLLTLFDVHNTRCKVGKNVLASKNVSYRSDQLQDRTSDNQGKAEDSCSYDVVALRVEGTPNSIF